MHSKDTFSDDMANFKMPRILNLISFRPIRLHSWPYIGPGQPLPPSGLV